MAVVVVIVVICSSGNKSWNIHQFHHELKHEPVTSEASKTNPPVVPPRGDWGFHHGWLCRSLQWWSWHLPSGCRCLRRRSRHGPFETRRCWERHSLWMLWSSVVTDEQIQTIVQSPFRAEQSTSVAEQTTTNYCRFHLPGCFSWFLMNSLPICWLRSMIYTQKLSAQLNDDSWLPATVPPAHQQWLHNGVQWITVSYCVNVGPATELKVCNGNAW